MSMQYKHYDTMLLLYHEEVAVLHLVNLILVCPCYGIFKIDVSNDKSKTEVSGQRILMGAACERNMYTLCF